MAGLIQVWVSDVGVGRRLEKFKHGRTRPNWVVTVTTLATQWQIILKRIETGGRDHGEAIHLTEPRQRSDPTNSAFVSWGCRKLQQTGRPQMCILWVPQFQKPGSKIKAPRCSRGESFLASYGFLWNHHFLASLVYGHITPVSAPACTCILPYPLWVCVFFPGTILPLLFSYKNICHWIWSPTRNPW